MDDRSYFYRRAEAELAMAQRTDVPEAVKAHYTLAGYYLDQVFGIPNNAATKAERRA